MTDIQCVKYLYACHLGAKRLARRLGWTYEELVPVLQRFPFDWKISAYYYGGYHD